MIDVQCRREGGLDVQCRREGGGAGSQCGLLVGGLAHPSIPHPSVEPPSAGPSVPLFASNPCTRWVTLLHSFDARGGRKATLIG